MDWNISATELFDIIDIYITKLINSFGNNIVPNIGPNIVPNKVPNKVPLQYIYINLNKELKIDGIVLRKNNKCRSINTYIKFKYKNWHNLLLNLNDKYLINKTHIILI